MRNCNSYNVVIASGHYFRGLLKSMIEFVLVSINYLKGMCF